MKEKPTYKELEQRVLELEKVESERIQVDKALRESEAKYRTLVNNIPDYVMRYDRKFRHIFANEKAIRDAGKTAEEYIDKTHREMGFPDDLCTLWENAIDRVYETGEMQSEIFEWKSEFGTKVLEWRVLPEFSEDGSILTVLGISQDITDLKMANDTIHKNQALLASTGSLSKVGGWEWDVDSQTMFWTEETYRIHGFDPDEVEPGSKKHIDKSIECYDPDDRPVILSAFKNCADKGKSYDFDFPFTKTTGERIWIRTVAKPVYEDGCIVKVIGNIMDITDKKELEIKIRDSAKMYRRLVEGVPDIIYSYSTIKGGVYYSPNVQKILGYSSSHLLQNPMLWHDSIHQDDLVQVDKVISEFREGTPFEVEYRIKGATGDWLWFIDRSFGRAKKNGEIVIEGVATDITHRKKVEEDLKSERFKLNEYFENLPMLAYNVTFDGKIADCNSTVLKTLGYDSKDELIGKSLVSTIYAPECREKAAKLVEKWKERKKIVNEEMQIITKTGKTIDVLLNVDTIFDHNGTPVHSLSTHLDITEKRIADEAIRESRQKYQSMVDNVGIGVALISPDMEVIELNRQMREWFPNVTNTGHGTICYRVFNDPPGDQVCSYCPTCKTLQDGKVHESITVTPSAGSIRNFRIISSPIMNAENEVIAAIEMVEDITERLKLENQLKQAQKLESLGTLAGGIAHDFNNILASIIGFTELSLDDVEKDSVIEDNLQEVYTAGKRAKDLVSQILAFARQSEEKVTPMRVDEIIKEVLRFMRSSIPTTIEIKTNLVSDSLIMGNKTQMHQILMNLCTNAAHAMEDEGGILEVSLKDIDMDKSLAKRLGLISGHYIEIDVIDTGTGIPPHIIDSIFEPYFTTKEPGEGTGMGLAVVHGIVEGYGGKIHVNSDHRKGTTFTIFLPITRKRRIQHQYEPELLPKGTERILLVDDEAPIVKMSRRNLEGLGYSVTSRTSSIEALEVFQAKPNEFDLVVTDMTMPNMTGDKLAVELMKIRQDIPVILCTGYSKKISDETASEIGIKAFAYKPIVKADLAKTVRKVLDDAKS